MANTEQKTALILQNSLDAIQSGKETVNSVLAQYPELEEELRPQLENAAWLMARKNGLDPDAGFLRRSRHRLVARIQNEQREAAAAPSWKTGLLSIFRMPPVVLRAAVTLLLVVMLLIGADRIVETTETAIPGDPGYTVKRTVENLSLAVSDDPGQKIVLNLEYSQRRLSEVNALVDTARYDDATNTLNEFQEQVENAVVSLHQVRDEDTVHKELLAMTIQEKLSAHTQQLVGLLPRVENEQTKQAVSEALKVSSSGVEEASSALRRLMTMHTPQPGEMPATPAVDSLLATLEPGVTPTDESIFQVFSTPTEEFRQIFSSTETGPEPVRTSEYVAPVLPVLPTALPPQATETPEQMPTSANPTEYVIPTRTPLAPTITPLPQGTSNNTPSSSEVNTPETGSLPVVETLQATP